MCTVDFNVFGQVWIENIGAAFPDFMTKHKCKNFEAVRQWASDNQVSVNRNDTSLMLRPGDIKLPDIP